MYLLVMPLFADSFIKIYPGVYIGGKQPTESGLIIGLDMQAGMELGSIEYDNLVFGVHGNIGIDSGLPNKPNLYYGGIMELYFGKSSNKFGISLVVGGSQGIANDNFKSVYLRAGLPVNYFGRFKTSVYFDWYPHVGSRLGI